MQRLNGRPVRILHVVGGMNRGGVETWLMHVLRHIDRERFRMDFLVHTTKPCAYDEEIRSLGSRIIPCLKPSRPWRYAVSFRRVLREFGPYDVVHSHVHHFSGFVMLLARLAGVHMRIAHSHNDTSLNDGSPTVRRRGYLRLTEHLIQRHATAGLACSRKAAAALFGGDWERDSRWRVLYCGIDLEPFKLPVDRAAVRKELEIPSDAFVLGHVGRFHEQKNHSFLIDIAAEVAKREPNMRLVLVGDGPLRTQIEEKVASLGLTDKVIFAGLRSDVPRLMKGAMDMFVMPSLHEGLPVVSIEAQAAGLPIIISNSITTELDVYNSFVFRMHLISSCADWAEMAFKIRQFPRHTEKFISTLESSSFCIRRSVNALKDHYDNSTLQAS